MMPPSTDRAARSAMLPCSTSAANRNTATASADRERGAAEEEIGRPRADHRCRPASCRRRSTLVSSVSADRRSAWWCIRCTPLRGLACWSGAASGAARLDRRRRRPMLAARRLTEPCTRIDRHDAERERRRGQEHQHRHHGSRVVADQLRAVQEARAIESMAQILKLTMRYMMKLPIPIQPPATPSAILVMSSCQTLP